jgi:hydroxymethylglutaryl-CoA lyase
MQNGTGIHVQINEVATRDGFQMEPVFIPTEGKIALIDRLGKLGYARIEVTSFTSPAAIPTLRDAAEVVAGIARRTGVAYTALIPNLRGAERALACGIDAFNLVMSCSETHNLANLRMTREQSVRQLMRIIELAGRHAVPVNVSLSCAFGCPMEGEVAADAVLGLVARFAGRGVAGVTLCDTTGMAHPLQVQALCGEAVARFPALAVTAHFHNTRGMGLLNVVAAVEAGVRRLDTALGGIGGCPYAPGATGNVATEDVVHMLHCAGYATGVDLEGVIEAAGTLRELVGHDLPAQVSAVGPRLRRFPVPADFDAIVARAAARDAEGVAA